MRSDVEKVGEVYEIRNGSTTLTLDTTGRNLDVSMRTTGLFKEQTITVYRLSQVRDFIDAWEDVLRMIESMEDEE